MQHVSKRVLQEEKDRKNNLICIRFLVFAEKSGSQIIQIPKEKRIIDVAPKNAYAFIASKDHRPPSSETCGRIYLNGVKITIDQAMQLLSKDKPAHIYTTPDAFITLKSNKNLEWAVLSRMVTSPSRKQGVFPLHAGDRVQNFI